MGGALAIVLAQSGPAFAFPFVDPSNQDSLPTSTPLPATAPTGTDLPATDVNGLRNQLRITNPAAPGNQSAWTIIPRLTMQEMFTDNVFEVSSPRRFDAITVIAPGISILANTARLQLNLDYQPNILLHAINGPLNVMTQQLNMTGLITVVPDLAFVDVRAVSGVQSRYGALAGNGTIGSANAGLATAGSTAGAYGGTGQNGTNPQNEVQTVSAGLSPYLLHQFKDYGTGKIGASADYSHYSSIKGFAATPFPTGGGTNGQSLLTTEQIAQFTTGEFFGRVQDSIYVDLQQSRSQADAGATIAVNTTQGTTTTIPATSFTSRRQTFSDQISYAATRSLTLLASIGEQNIYYSGGAAPRINGLTWNAGFSYTPGPDSSVTLTYGHLNGSNNFNASGYVAIGGRTQLNISYSDTVGTQLENIQNQLNNSVVGANGQLVNAQTGGPNFAASNAVGVQNGVFRFDTLNVGLTTGWLRDTLQANAVWSIQTNLTPGGTQTQLFVDPTTGQLFVVPTRVAGTNQKTDAKTFSLGWTHELSPDLTLTSSATYSIIQQSGGVPGYSSISAAVGLQYILTASSSLSARYSFFDRGSKIPGYSIYENILLLGFTKQF